MGNVVSGVISAGSNLLSSLSSALSSALQYAWDEALVPILETALATIGITDSDLLVTQVLSQKLSQDTDLLKSLLVSLAIEGTKTDRSSINDIIDILASGKAKYTSYYNYGKNTYIDGLPECTVKTSVIYNAAVKNAIALDIGTIPNILSIFKKRPNYLEWSYYYLQTNYEYSLSSNTFMYMNISAFPIPYVLDYIDTNDNWTYYKVYATAYEDKTTTVSNIADVTITNYDATYDLQTTTVTQKTLIVGEYSGTISDSSTVISSYSVLIPIGSGTPSTNTSIVSKTIETIFYDNIELTITEPLPQLYYVVKYYTTSVNEEYYWIYLIGEGTYITLESDDTYITNLELFPSVTIRNSGESINSTSDETRYNDSKKLLRYLGLSLADIISNVEENPNINDIQDTFIHFGISPNDTNEICSKILYEMFNYILTNEDLLIVESPEGSTTYSIVFKEDPMNIILSWKHTPINTTSGVLSDNKTYNHYVSSGNLYLQKQINDTTYQTITLDTLQSATVIKREGISGLCSLAPNDDNFFIPLSFYYVKQLTISEQVELIGISLRLTSYAAQVVHLEWYETSTFMGWLEFIGYATLLYTGVSGGWLKAFVTLMIAYGSSFVLQKIFKATDNKFIRLLAITSAVALTVYGANTFNTTLTTYDLAMITASSLTSFTTLMFNTDISMLTDKINALEKEYSTVSDEYNDILNELHKNDYILDILLPTNLPVTAEYKQDLDLYYSIVKGDIYKNYSLVYDSTYSSIHNFYDNALRIEI